MSQSISNQDRSLEGKLAIITGASRGIGIAVTEHLAAKGANIVINYTSKLSKDKAEKLTKTLESEHKVQTILAKADMGSEQGPANIVEMIKNHFSADKSEKFQIDIIVNNAGVTNETPLANIKIELFD